MVAVKWILWYLFGTIDVRLLFKKDGGQQYVRYCDSDFAGDLDKRISTTGYVFTLGGSPISWRSVLQSTIALSSTEAEYMTATEAVKEAIWLRGLLGDFGKIQKNIEVFCDNQSTIFFPKKSDVSCSDDPSDMLTKVISGIKFQHCLKLIQILRFC